MMHGRSALVPLALCALLGAGIAACESPSAPPVPAAVVAVAGDLQTGVAGLPLAAAPGVRVEDARGRPIAEVPVTFTVIEGGGSTETGTAITDASGAASAGSWALGPHVGTNVLTASVEGLPAVRFTAHATPGAPAVLRVHAGGVQSMTVGERVAVIPTVVVLDANENRVPGAPVTFNVALGDGLLEGGGANGSASASSVTLATDGDGLAAPRAWQLGTTAGANSLEARVAGLAGSAVFLATGEPGPANLLQPLSDGSQTARVGETVPEAPGVRVTDRYGNAVGGVPVTFTVTGGDGGIAGPGGPAGPSAALTLATDAAGRSVLGAWILGTRTGGNHVDVRVDGIASPVRFEAMATAGPAARATAHAGEGQSASAGSTVPVAPAVLVEDVWGNAVPGVLVTFEVTSGGGAVSGSMRMTAADGIAELVAWTLGPLPGPNSIAAHVDGVATVHFSATGTSGSGGSGGTPSLFTLELRYTTPISGSGLAIFNAAADRWAGAITGDLPAVFVSVAEGGCGAPHPAVNEMIDDVVVYVTVQAIDGPGKILGSAGPCRIRPNGLPALGIVYLDSDDLDGLEASGLLEDVILHEIGHVLGIGTLWPPALVLGAGGTDPVFTGTTAVSRFLGAGGSAYTGTPVPIENTGGPGTKDAHWRESVLASELMTGWINYGGNPLSGITIGSLQDMGFEVDMSAADGFQVSGISSLGLGPGLPGVEMIERALPPPIVATGAIEGANLTAAGSLSGVVARYKASR